MVKRGPMDHHHFTYGKRIARGFRALVRKPLRLGGWCLGFCLHLVGVVGYPMWTFFRKWSTSRPFAPLAWGVLAVVAVVVVGLLAATGHRVSRSDLVVRYRQSAAEAAARGDAKAVELWLEKAVLLNPNDKAFHYGLALTAEQDGRHDRARQIMRTLAPDDRTGYGPAHLWIASHIARSRQEAPSDRDAQTDSRTDTDQAVAGRLRHHLTAIVQYDPDNLAALEELARLELSQRNLPEAIEQLERLVRKDRTFSLRLAQLHVIEGDREKSRSVADAGTDYFRRQVESNPDDIESRIHWARLHGFMEQFDRTVEILIEGAVRKPAPEDMNRLRMELGHAFLGWAKHVERTQPDEVALRLDLLQKALKCTPDHPQVLEQLAALVRDDSAEARAAYYALSTALADGTATPMVHLMLGIAAYKRDKYDLEKQHLRLALAADPQLVIAANNLAWRLANSDPPQLDEALELIEQTVKHDPNRPEVRATRGRIYQLIDRTDDAIVDLEFALSRLKDRPDIHTALADLYASIGDQDLARLHRERATTVGEKDD
ncbi:MAG: tetratricopeptide repeat protein [Planctomycetes bacterium]|nr:tetratricopeptide repeat protein [Planctomycetota bacterium]